MSNKPSKSKKRDDHYMMEVWGWGLIGLSILIFLASLVNSTTIDSKGNVTSSIAIPIVLIVIAIILLIRYYSYEK